MLLRVRLPSVLYRRRLTAAGTNRRLTDVLVEALRDETIFADLLARTDPQASVDEEIEPTDEDIDLAAQRHEDLLRGPWRDS
jgi:hypothetical protein|tara:strand:- start:646 stop:891 length:246 start_codon:yes stop_codon:yes gene_type:complete